MKTGYWNGEPTAKYEGITYEVTEVAGTPLHWQNSVVGKRRHALRITQDGQTWIIDNENGDGHYKLHDGKGMWTTGHKSVENPANIEVISDDHIKEHINRFRIKLEEKVHDRWMEEKDPAAFNRLLSLRKAISKMQRP